MSESNRWTARLRAGPFDGATLGVDLDQDDVPRAVVVSFAVGDSPAALVWHSYVLDRSRTAFRYLGEDPVHAPQERVADAAPLPGDGFDPVASGDDVTRRFYDLLVERHPELRPMFPADLRPQAAMLRSAIKTVLRQLDDPGLLSATLGALGAKHAEWGVTESMYDDFCACLLSAMAEVAGTAWTPELHQDWHDTLTDISDLMLAGAAPHPA